MAHIFAFADAYLTRMLYPCQIHFLHSKFGHDNKSLNLNSSESENTMSV